MVNYKTPWDSLEWNGYRRHIPNKAIVKHLTEQVDGSTAADTMIDIADLAAYAVATGKVFHLLGVEIWCDTPVAGGTIALKSGDTEDAETSTVHTLELPMVSQKTGEGTKYIIDQAVTWASGKFVVINPSGTTVDQIHIVGFEI